VAAQNAGPLSEMTAVVAGYGVLLMNGACFYMKGCGGLRMHKGTHLTVEELAVATAIFVRLNGKKPGCVRSHAAATQREAFDEALCWVDSNDAIVAALRDHPEVLADGIFPIEPARGFLTRLFSTKPKPIIPALPSGADLKRGTPPMRPKRVRTEAELARLAEAKALVDDVLGSR